jgi:hypothetical protein
MNPISHAITIACGSALGSGLLAYWRRARFQSLERNYTPANIMRWRKAGRIIFALIFGVVAGSVAFAFTIAMVVWS